MRATPRTIAAWPVLAVIGAASPALADFSACDAALGASDPQRQIELYTTCLTKGGLPLSDQAGAFTNRGVAYLKIGESDRALQDFSWAIEDDPNWGAAYIDRGLLYARRGDCAKAASDFDKAVAVSIARLRGPALVHEAWLYATCPDPAIRNPRKAIDLANASLKLQDGPNGRDALAVAFAAAGQFDDAVREETRAIELAGKTATPDQLAQFQVRLDGFRKAAAGALASDHP